MSEIVVSKEREKEISEVMFRIKTKYNLHKNLINTYVTFCINNIDFKVKDIEENIKFIKQILDSYNYSDDEINEYFNRNRIILLANNSDLTFKIIILNHFNLLDEALFKYYNLLNYKCYFKGFKSRELYSLLMENPNIKLEEINKKFDSLSKNEIMKLKTKYPLNNEILKTYYSELKKQLFIKKLQSKKELKKQGF